MNIAPQVTGPEEGEALWSFGTLVLVKLAGQAADGQFCLVEQYGRRGVATLLHLHVRDQETFHVLEGELRFYLEDQAPVSAPAGTTVFVPSGAPHA